MKLKHERIHEFSSRGGGGGGPGQCDKKSSGDVFFFFFFSFSPQLVLQELNGQFLRNLIFFHGSRGGPTFSRGSNFFQGVQLLIPYRNPYNVIFQWGGGGGSGPPVSPLDPHLSNNYLGRTIISLCTGNWWKMFKYFILQKKKSTAGETRTRSLRVRITYLLCTRLIAYTVFVLCSSTCTIGNTRTIAKYNELFHRKLFRP